MVALASNELILCLIVVYFLMVYNFEVDVSVFARFSVSIFARFQRTMMRLSESHDACINGRA